MSYHGITLGIKDPETLVDYQRIKSWNMNVVLLEYFWADIENYVTQAYNETVLNTIRSQVDLAHSLGFQVIQGIRPSYDPTDDFTFDYMNMTDEGRNRYLRFLQMMAERFSDCGFSPCFFLYHHQSVSDDDGRARTFYETTFPAMLAVLRPRIGNHPIVFSPVHQGAKIINGVRCDSGWYRSDEPLFGGIKAEWYPDVNLLWNISTHEDYNDVVQCGLWDRNETRLEWNYSGARQFHAKYPNQTLFSEEYSNLAIHNCVRPATDIDPSRLAWVTRNCQIMKELGAGWTYYGYSRFCTWSTPQLPDGTDSALALILKEYAPIPAPKLPLATVGGIALGTFLGYVLSPEAPVVPMIVGAFGGGTAGFIIDRARS